MKKFFELIEDQYTYGGKKYATDNTGKESTDILFDIFGSNWLYGTMAKYCFRFRNLARERDLLKIATYAYLLYLKRGFYLDEEGTNFVVDTNPKIKVHQFSYFCEGVKTFYNETFSRLPKTNYEERLFILLSDCSKKDFLSLELTEILFLFCYAYEIWKEHNYDGGDTDTWNK